MHRFGPKTRKLLRNPSLFFRDYLLNRHPLELSADINRPRKHDAETSAKKTQPRTKANRAKKAPIAKTQRLFDGFIQPAFPIDIVYTWVDADDPNFKSQLQRELHPDAPFKVEAIYESRFKSRDELKYSLRSIFAYAPWVRNIYVVTNGQVPTWLNTDNDRVKIIPHSDIIPDEYLPTFNSHVIESCLHKIPGLAEHYVYFNDDVMLLRPVKPTDFFTENGLMHGFVSSATIPNGPKTYADTPSMWAIKNARTLIFNKTGYYLSAKFAHTYHPQLKSVAEQNEATFADSYHACRMNRFRHDSDILCSSFLNPCMAYITGRAVFAKTRAWYFNIRDVGSKNLYRSLLRMRGQPDCPYSVCLNDHVSPNVPPNFPDYDEHLRAFLDAYYPNESPIEYSDGPGVNDSEEAEVLATDTTNARTESDRSFYAAE